MAKTIAVCGATGGQGGSVARILLKRGEWKVRAITRNVESRGAKALAAQGAEVVAADLDDEESLVKAFDGVQAIFGVTNFWEELAKLGAEAASTYEQGQAIKLASAAAKTKTLEHYIWSTLPSTKTPSGGKHFVPHMEPKSQVDQYIRDKLPELAKKTTFLWVAWYAANLAKMPLIKLMEVVSSRTPLSVFATPSADKVRVKPGSGKYIWPQPSKASAMLPNSGDIGVNIGVFTAAILAHPEISLPGKYAWVQTEKTTFQEIMETWSKVTGKDAVYVDLSAEQYIQLWGPYGLEMSKQYAFGAEYGDWDDLKPGLLGAEQLQIGKDELVGLQPFLESIKSTL
ncbi:hypothetical protein MMC26_003978 [Xylographa opegraphella]|nr:hypothetical protein [Xylographa opegraphella]